nr:hypothetical protein [Tanacetum cinerariifolium]
MSDGNLKLLLPILNLFVLGTRASSSATCWSIVVSIVLKGLQVTQNIEDSHVTLTPVHPDGPQESSSVSSFVTSMLNPISDAGVESIFTTASSPIVSLQTPTPIMTPSTIATITTSRDAPIPLITIPSIIVENLPTFNLAFRFDERLRSLETTFSEYRQTNPFVDAVSAIPADLSEMELKKILIEKMEGNKRPPSSDRDWNKTLPAAQGDAQSWINTGADKLRQARPLGSFPLGAETLAVL